MFRQHFKHFFKNRLGSLQGSSRDSARGSSREQSPKKPSLNFRSFFNFGSVCRNGLSGAGKADGTCKKIHTPDDEMNRLITEGKEERKKQQEASANANNGNGTPKGSPREKKPKKLRKQK